jgi:hypothetical protein
MSQQLNPNDWPSICFEGEILPQSVKGISILIDREFTERTGDWIWRFPHCKGVWKEGEAEWCIQSANEIMDHLLEHRTDIIGEIQERLGPHGFDGTRTIEEWFAALGRIRDLAKSRNGICRWIAGEPSERARETVRRFLAFLDRQTPSDP